MRILITGASGNLGTGLAERLAADGHELVLSDLHPPPNRLSTAHLFVPLDIQVGVGLERAAEGCDLILHLPAWHGIHARSRTEIDFWRLNVDGTFWMFQAAVAVGIQRVVFLSSQSWHGHYDKYGFTKRIGEELCEYYRRNHDIRYVAVRPADFTPCARLLDYGTRLLYGGVDRDDVIDATAASVRHLTGEAFAEAERGGLVVNAVRAKVFDDDDLLGWDADPVGTCARIFGPAAGDLVEKYELDIARRPIVVDLGDGGPSIGYRPTRHFGTFIAALAALDERLDASAVRELGGPGT